MAVVRTQDYTSPLTYEARQVNLNVLFSDANDAVAYSATTGWQKGGCIGSPSDQRYNITPKTVTVDSGAILTAKDELVVGMEGMFECLFIDLNHRSAEKSGGTTITTTFTNDATSWTGTIAASTTASRIYVGSGETTGLSAGDRIKFTLSSGNTAFTAVGIVKNITSASNYFDLEHALDEIPPTAGTATRVSGYSLFHGGNVIQNHSLLFQQDFPGGEQWLLHVFKGSVRSGVSRQFGEYVKTPVSGIMYGTSQTAGSLTNQVCCAATYATYPNG